MTPERLLVLKPGSLGDIVHTLPAVAALKARHPSCAITWMVNPEWEPLLEGNPHVASTLIFPRGDFRGPAGLLRFAAWRRGLPGRLQPDLILDFQGLLRTAVIGRAFRGVPMWGLSDAREGSRLLHTRTLAVDGKAHAVERYLVLAAALGGVPAGPLLGSLARMGVAAAALAAACVAGQHWLGPWLAAPGLIDRMWSLLAVIGAGAAVYFGACTALGVGEARDAVALLGRKLGRGGRAAAP